MTTATNTITAKTLNIKVTELTGLVMSGKAKQKALAAYLGKAPFVTVKGLVSEIVTGWKKTHFSKKAETNRTMKQTACRLIASATASAFKEKELAGKKLTVSAKDGAFTVEDIVVKTFAQKLQAMLESNDVNEKAVLDIMALAGCPIMAEIVEEGAPEQAEALAAVA